MRWLVTTLVVIFAMSNATTLGMLVDPWARWRMSGQAGQTITTAAPDETTTRPAPDPLNLDPHPGRVTDQYRYLLGFDEQHMRATFNAFDVLLSVSRGEGFGIPILEAQACGTPVIVGDWTAMSELCFAGWKVNKEDAYRERTMLESYWYVVKPGAVAEALEAAYDARGDKRLRREAVKGAKPYAIDEVTRRYLKPLMREMEERIEMGKAPAGVAA